MNTLYLEKFYVYRCLGAQEKWKTLLLGSKLSDLENIDFGMKVFARNEKEAIGKAKETYDKIHVYDSDKENIRRFAAAALKHFIKENADVDVAAQKVMKYAVALLSKYNEHFDKLNESNSNDKAKEA